MSPSVSVIVPIYQSELWLRSCLQALLMQTLQSIEVILVDDASTDKSAAIAQQFCEKAPHKFRLIQLSQNRGVSRARNMGMAEARGEYLGFVDSDDLVEPEMFEQLYLAATQGNCDWVSCRMWRFYSERPLNRQSVELHEHYDDTYVTNKLFRKSWIESIQLKFYPDVIFEDEPFVYIAKLCAKRFKQLPQHYYSYRMNPLGYCRNPQKTRFNLYDKKLMLVRFLADLEQRGLLNGNRKMLMQCLANHALSALYYENNALDKQGFFRLLKQLAAKYRLDQKSELASDYKINRFFRFAQKPWLFSLVLLWLPIKPWYERLLAMKSQFRLEEKQP